MTENQDVLFTEMSGIGDLGIITLNRPDVLNSLNHHMILAITAKLQQWASDTRIKAVVIRATEGRAFCAGGDLRLTYNRFKHHESSALEFFRDEYQLNKLIFHFPKPYIALLDGITMGGGVGISIHGSHRIATNRLLFAMPETGIGFFPDVGGTYFLPRLSGFIGFYLGLTGARIASDDCVHLGIANLQVGRDALEDIVSALANTPFHQDARQAVTDILQPFQLAITTSELKQTELTINSVFAKNTMEEILMSLHASDDPVCHAAEANILKKSPTSLKVTLKALQLGKQMNFDACMQQEFRLVNRFFEGHDFVEGIRAVIIDKDQKPHWQPKSLEGVTHEMVEKYFASLTHELA